MESQFGGRFKYFETGQDTVATFFGSNEEKFEIETYEFYHLIFEWTIYKYLYKFMKVELKKDKFNHQS